MKNTHPQEEWSVEPVNFTERETLVEVLLRRILELETQLAATQNVSEHSIR